MRFVLGGLKQISTPSCQNLKSLYRGQAFLGSDMYTVQMFSTTLLSRGCVPEAAVVGQAECTSKDRGGGEEPLVP